LEWIYGIINIDVWRSRIRDYSRKETLRSNITNISN
jgi:hypothetical protein